MISMHIKVRDDLAYKTTNFPVLWANCGDFVSSRDHNHPRPTDSDSIRLGWAQEPTFWIVSP